MIQFYEKRRIFFAITAVVMIAGIVSLFINGVNLSIQFKGGAILKYSFEGSLDENKVASRASEILNRNAEVQVVTDMATGSKKIVLNLAGNSGLAADEQERLDSALKTEFADADLELSESNVVEPFIGMRFLRNGLTAIAVSFVFIILYVWYRFKRISGLSAGVIALMALIHDVLIVFFTFTIFRIPINDSFIAVTLTIIGYSINDTIVIYDRIRENKSLYPKMPLEELMDKSVTQSLKRSINTSLTTVISVLIVYIFAVMYNIESIKTFALPMMMGLVTGLYSSVCLTGSVWVMWQKRQKSRRTA